MTERQPPEGPLVDAANDLLDAARAMRSASADAAQAVARFVIAAKAVQSLDEPAAETVADLAVWAGEMFPNPGEFDADFLSRVQAVAARLVMVASEPERFSGTDSRTG